MITAWQAHANLSIISESTNNCEGQGCATLDCVKEKGVELCTECSNFPCALLAPTADGAKNYPHNLKVYNLCLIKQTGIEHWIEEAATIRKRYFTNTFVVGKGQAQNE
jgi:hypothetical protein